MSPVPNIVFNENEINYKYILDYSAYNSNKKIDDLVKIEYLGISRDRHLASLKIKSAYYENGNVMIPHKVIIKISFDYLNTSNQKQKNDDFDIVTSINHFESDIWKINFNKNTTDNYKKDKVQNNVEQVWLKLKIDKEGVYRINVSDISALGYSIPKDEIPTIKIYGHGGKELDEKVSSAEKNILNEQEIIVRTTSSGDLDRIIFYAAGANGFSYNEGTGFSHYINHYSNSNYYLLTWKGQNGKRATALPAITEEPLHRPTTYTNMVFFEEEMHNAFVGGSGRQWFGRNLLPTTFVEPLHNLDRSGQITYRVSVAHRASRTGKFTIKENNKELFSISLSPISGYYDAMRQIKSTTVPADYIAGDNRSSLNFNYQNDISSSSALGYFDWYEIYYPSYLTPIDNQISIFTDANKTGITEYSINNFTNNDIIAFDVSEVSNPKLIANSASTGGMFVFKSDVKSNFVNKYFISANLKKPDIERMDFVNLRNDNSNADLILITHPKLIESATKYKEYREKQSNLKVDIVRTDNIFNEFASCIPDPTSIRDYLAWTYNNWTNKPKYVLLWGDGHYDYKNIDTKDINFVPTYQTEDVLDSFYETYSFTTDDFFANIVGNDKLVDLAIGRLPIYSNESGYSMIEKIKHYENNSSLDSWRTNVTIVADDSWRTGGADRSLHTGQAESLWTNIIPPDYATKKIYLPEYPTSTVSGGRRKPRVMEDIISTVNTSGNVLLCFIGHGNPRVWTHEEVFEKSITVPQMKNLDKLFFLTAASCDFGRFDDPSRRSGAEELVLSPFGGAIGTFSSTRLVYAEANARLNELFYSNVFSRNASGRRYTIGEISYLSKIIRYDENDQKYCLLADPSVKLLLPDYYSVIDSINGISLSEADTAQLKALSKITIKGHISSPSSTLTDNTFNGTVIINMLDCDQYMRAFEDDGTEFGTVHRYWKNGGALNRSSYKVENGKFVAEFFIPKDISFAYKPGRLFAYAYTADNRFANGDNRQFIITGIEDIVSPDNEGPEIDIYLDSRDFLSGNIVKCTPLLIVDLKDESGINTTGLGLGHRIEAWIDNSPISIDLTDNFRTSIGDSKTGSVETLLFDLKPGLHEIKIRAWDVFNNYSEKSTLFRITDCNEVVISNVIAYPNPAQDNVTIRFYHNISPPFEAELFISNVLGQNVRNLEQKINTSLTGEIKWDIFDNNGAILPSGNYSFYLMIRNSQSVMETTNGIITIIR
jgi:hypothetical protein